MGFFFLMASERSGSNLITRIMDAHFNICGPAAKHILNPVARNLFRYGELDRPDNWRELIRDIEQLVNADFSRWRSCHDLDSLHGLARVGRVGELVRNIYLEEARAAGKQHVFVKENQVYEFFPFLRQEFPEARYLFLVRDPRDMAVSWKANSDHPGGAVTAAYQWRKDQVQNMKNYSLEAAAGKAVKVRYEDLVSQPVMELTRVCEAIGVPYDEGMLAFNEDPLTKENAAANEAWRNLDRPLIQDNWGKYREHLSADEIRAVESICFYEMRFFGYPTEAISTEEEAMGDGELTALKAEEDRLHPRRPSERVLANMAVKRRFYRRDGGAPKQATDHSRS